MPENVMWRMPSVLTETGPPRSLPRYSPVRNKERNNFKWRSTKRVGLFLLLSSKFRSGSSLPLSTRYWKRPPMVRKGHSVRKTASCGTRRIFRSIRCKKQAFPVRNGYSVPKTAFSGTRRIFSARNGLREEASKHKKRMYSLEKS